MHRSYHKAMLIMFSCDGMSDYASWKECFLLLGLKTLMKVLTCTIESRFVWDTVKPVNTQ